MSADLMTLRELSIGYRGRPVLSGLSLALARGRFVGLLGANGSGKSTLIKTILGILPPLAGEIVLTSVKGVPPILGYVPQREALDSIFPLSSLEVVLMGACGRVGPGRWINRAERAWALDCLRDAGAEDLSRRRFSELSGGQRQRVLIARALAAKPDLLVLDEPTAGIDASATQGIMELLDRLHRRQALTILMVNHDLAAVRKAVEQVIWLHEGQVLFGAVGDLLSHERIEAIMALELN